MTLAGEKEDPPNRPYGNQGYVCAGIDGAAGTMMALVHRDNTGEGQQVDVSMQEALSINMETAMMTYDMNQRVATRTGSKGVIPISLPGIGIFDTQRRADLRVPRHARRRAVAGHARLDEPRGTRRGSQRRAEHHDGERAQSPIPHRSRAGAGQARGANTGPRPHAWSVLALLRQHEQVEAVRRGAAAAADDRHRLYAGRPGEESAARAPIVVSGRGARSSERKRPLRRSAVPAIGHAVVAPPPPAPAGRAQHRGVQ